MASFKSCMFLLTLFGMYQGIHSACPLPEWIEPGNGNCYKFFPEEKNYHDAKTHCENQYAGSNLVSLPTEIEKNVIYYRYFLQELLKDDRSLAGIWIGTDTVPPQQVGQISLPWLDGSPSNLEILSEERSSVLFASLSTNREITPKPVLFDVSILFPFVCEMPSTPN